MFKDFVDYLMLLSRGSCPRIISYAIHEMVDYIFFNGVDSLLVCLNRGIIILGILQGRP